MTGASGSAFSTTRDTRAGADHRSLAFRYDRAFECAHVEAKRMFRKALELNPAHVEATREMRLIAMRESRGGTKLIKPSSSDKGGKSSGGFFGFRRKK